MSERSAERAVLGLFAASFMAGIGLLFVYILGGTLGAIAAVGRRASVLRVHDVAAVADFLRVWDFLEGPEEAVPALDPALRREDPVA